MTFPIANELLRARFTKRQSARLWVDHLVLSRDCKRIGAAAGRSAVIVTENGTVLSTFESQAGTITGISFLDHALVIASYGEVHWLEEQNQNTPKLRRGGAAVQCIDVSPKKDKLAVGFLDKTVRVYSLANDLSAVDWVGFDASVQSVRFSEGNWLAVMGGSTILILDHSLQYQSIAPTIYR